MSIASYLTDDHRDRRHPAAARYAERPAECRRRIETIAVHKRDG
jgi:hypothetical protein